MNNYINNNEGYNCFLIYLRVIGNDCFLKLSDIKKGVGNMFLFSWDNVPGKDNGRLVEYLEQKYGVDWARTAKIEKIDNNEIRVATEKNFLSLRLNNENTKVTLTINNVRTDEFIVSLLGVGTGSLDEALAGEA
jgi:hypothetical protein